MLSLLVAHSAKLNTVEFLLQTQKSDFTGGFLKPPPYAPASSSFDSDNSSDNYVTFVILKIPLIAATYVISLTSVTLATFITRLLQALLAGEVQSVAICGIGISSAKVC